MLLYYILREQETEMYQEKQVSALILMGGSGQRFSNIMPKQFHRIGGKRIYLHTLHAFLKVKEIDKIVLVTHIDWVDEVKKELPQNSSIKISIIAGGKTRQESTYLGLQEISNASSPETSDLVLVHDGARPFVSTKIIQENIEKAAIHGAVDTCIPSSDTIVETIDGDSIHRIKERKTYQRGQTPQTFNTKLLFQAHKQALDLGITNASDDCQLVLKLLNHPIYITKGDETNIKITSPLDIYLADQLLRIKKSSPKDIEKSQNILKDKVFAIVGGTGGIGKALSTMLEKREAKALLLSPSSKDFFIDLCDRESIEHAFQKIAERFGPIDGLINSGGYLHIENCDKLSYENIEKMLKINLEGLIYSCKEVSLKSQGVILNIASSSFSYGRKGYSIYSAAKAGVVNFTQSLAAEMEDLRINCVVPSRTNTPMRRKNFPNENVNELLDPKFVAKKILEVICDKDLTGAIVDIKKSDEA